MLGKVADKFCTVAIHAVAENAAGRIVVESTRLLVWAMLFDASMNAIVAQNTKATVEAHLIVGFFDDYSWKSRLHFHVIACSTPLDLHATNGTRMTRQCQHNECPHSSTHGGAEVHA